MLYKLAIKSSYQVNCYCFSEYYSVSLPVSTLCCQQRSALSQNCSEPIQKLKCKAFRDILDKQKVSYKQKPLGEWSLIVKSFTMVVSN